jgi:Generalcontrol nonderepressible 1 (Gcn1) N-terminal
MVRDALTHRLNHEDSPHKDDSADGEREYLELRQGRFHAILAASASLPANLDLDLRERELVQIIILAHHPAICMSFRLLLIRQVRPQLLKGGTSRSAWIEACQRARVDPHHLVSHRANELMQLIWENVDMAKNVCAFS